MGANVVNHSQQHWCKQVGGGVLEGLQRRICLEGLRDALRSRCVDVVAFETAIEGGNKVSGDGGVGKRLGKRQGVLTL